MAQAPRDQNFVPALLLESDSVAGTTITAKGDQATGRLLVDSASGSGTVTDVSVVTANGFAGTVANSTTTPAITLSTTITGILSGNGTAISAASTTGSGAVVLANSPTFVDDITLGAAAGTTGSILFKGTTSGTITMKSKDAAGTWTFTLPDSDGSDGQVLTTDGSGVTSWEDAGGVPTTITVANEATDTSCFLGFFTAATGDLGPKTNANLTFDSSTGIATFGQTIAGSISGNAATATTATNVTVADEASDTSCFLSFTTAATGNLGIKSNANMTFNSNTGVVTLASSVLTTTDINGGTIDNATIGATTASTIVGTTITANTSFLPDVDGGAALGSATLGFSILGLSSGSTINWANGNAVLTHSSAVLTVSTGDLRVTTAGTNAASAVTVGGTQTLTNKTLTSPTVTTATLSGAQQLAEGAGLRLDAALSADGTYSGTTISGTAGATLAFGDVVYLAAADSRWELADADSNTTSGGVLIGFCVLAAASDGDPTVILLDGNIRADAAFPALTVGAPAYISTTAGDITTTQPSGTDDVIQVVGFGLTADSLLVRISPDYITHT